jgi:HEAT repeat protein
MAVSPLAFPPRDPAGRRWLHIAQNLRDLASRESGVLTAALARLGELAPSGEELLRLLGDRDPFVRSGAARQLRHVTGPLVGRVVDALRGAIDDPNNHVVCAALGSLGALRAQPARADVRACLEDGNAHVVHAAVFALGLIGPSEEGQHLVRFLTSPHPHLQLVALRALEQLRYAPAAAAIVERLEACLGALRRTRQDFEFPHRLLSALVGLRAAEAVPLLVRMARTAVGLRGAAVQALIDLRAESAAPALLPLLAQLLDSPHEERLCNALLNLMLAVEYHFALPEVRRFLGHRQQSVRATALRLVVRWHDAEAIEAVRQMCHTDASAFLRPEAVTALVHLAGSAALPDLEELASDANARVRLAVAEALGGLAPLPEQGIAVLTRLLADPATAEAASAALDRHGADADPAPTLLPLGPTAALLPPELRAQAPAARAFLRSWLEHLPAGTHRAETVQVQHALGQLLGVLGEGLPRSAAA